PATPRTTKAALQNQRGSPLGASLQATRPKRSAELVYFFAAASASHSSTEGRYSLRSRTDMLKKSRTNKNELVKAIRLNRLSQNRCMKKPMTKIALIVAMTIATTRLP